jgi:hypothetical protein
MAEKHITYWWSAKNGNTRPKKRYVLLFSLKGQYGVNSLSRSEFDNIGDCEEECKELNKMYSTHKVPTVLEKKWDGVYPKKKHLTTVWDYSDNRSWWGYIVLDMQECKAIKVGGYGFNCTNYKCYDSCRTINTDKAEKDYFFRDPEVCPDEYEWKQGEYKGWLQFKWGDGKNAIGYVEPPKPKKKEVEKIDPYEDYELESEFVAEMIEDKYDSIIEKETQKRLMDKYGW